jgi:hypothetical protein
MLGWNGDTETDGGTGGYTPRAGKVGPRSNPGPYLFERGGQMAAIMSLDEPRPRGTVLGERTTGVAFVRSNIFSDARRATAGSTRGITYGLRITKARCRTRARSSAIARQDRQRGPVERLIGV